MVAKKKETKKKTTNKKNNAADFDGDFIVIDEPVAEEKKVVEKEDNEEHYRCKDIINKHKNIAVYGMSENEEKPSHYVPLYFIDHGYNIMPINPKAKKIGGLKVSKTLKDIEGTIEILDVFRPSQDVLGVVEEAIERNKEKGDIKVIWLQEGIVNDEAKSLAEGAGIEFVQDRCVYKEFVKILPERK